MGGWMSADVEIEARRLVLSIARRLARELTLPPAVDVEDLVQDGMLGLLDAEARFDEARGIKFETFAERRVRGAMLDGLRGVSAPRGILRARREVAEARRALRAELGRDPGVAELAGRLGTPEAWLRRTLHAVDVLEATHPLATTVEGVDLPPALKPPPAPPPDRAVEVAGVRAAVAALPARERTVLVRRFRGDARRDIAADLGVCESRVDQIRARAIRRVREGR